MKSLILSTRDVVRLAAPLTLALCLLSPHGADAQRGLIVSPEDFAEGAAEFLRERAESELSTFAVDLFFSRLCRDRLLSTDVSTRALLPRACRLVTATDTDAATATTTIALGVLRRALRQDVQDLPQNLLAEIVRAHRLCVPGAADDPSTCTAQVDANRRELVNGIVALDFAQALVRASLEHRDVKDVLEDPSLLRAFAVSDDVQPMKAKWDTLLAAMSGVDFSTYFTRLDTVLTGVKTVEALGALFTAPDATPEVAPPELSAFCNVQETAPRLHCQFRTSSPDTRTIAIRSQPGWLTAQADAGGEVVLEGTPAAAGTYPLVVDVTEGAATTTTTLTVTVVAGANRTLSIATALVGAPAAPPPAPMAAAAPLAVPEEVQSALTALATLALERTRDVETEISTEDVLRRALGVARGFKTTFCAAESDVALCEGAWDDAFDVVDHIVARDYSAALAAGLGSDHLWKVIRLAVVHEVSASTPGRQSEWTERARRYLTLVADLATAVDADSFDAALERFSAPLGSWRRKHEVRGGFALQGYAGLSVGLERAVGGGHQDTVRRGASLAPTLSIGFQGHARPLPNWRVFFYIPLVDVGNVVSVRIASESDDALTDVEPLPDITWAQLFAPGLYLGTSLHRSPIDFAVGFNYIPALRTVEGTGDETAVIRFGAFIATDITIMPIR